MRHRLTVIILGAMIAIAGAPQVSQQFQDLRSAAAAHLQTGLWGAILNYHAQETGRLTARELPARAANLQTAENRNAHRQNAGAFAAIARNARGQQDARAVEAQQQHHEAPAPADRLATTEDNAFVAANIVPALFRAPALETNREVARAERDIVREIREAAQIEARGQRAEQRDAAATEALTPEAAQARFMRVAALESLPANLNRSVKTRVTTQSRHVRFRARPLGAAPPAALTAPAPRANTVPRAPLIVPVASAQPEPCPDSQPSGLRLGF